MTMRKNSTVTANRPEDELASPKSNGNASATHENGSVPLTLILAGLQTMRDGDFSVRLPGSWTGLAGKVADTFNEIISANQQMAQELKRIGQAVVKVSSRRRHTKFYESRGSWGEMEVSVN